MEINLNKAVQGLNSVDRELRKIAGQPARSGNAADQDTVEIRGESRGKVYSAGFTALNNELADKLASLSSLVEQNSGQQGKLSGLFGNAAESDDVRARAQELLDTYFNVENTGNRIFDFAFSFYDGGDREAFAGKMKDAIYKGFALAEKQLGGLADISLETRDYIDERIENFIDEGKEEAGDTVEVAPA